MTFRIRVSLALFLSLAAAALAMGVIAAFGTTLWQDDGVPVCVANNNQVKVQIISDGAGGAIMAWNDSRSSNNDIYAQRLDGNGNGLWVTDGVSLCAATGGQGDPQLVSDEFGGAIVTWGDSRTGGNDDIYAQRVDANGNTLWYTDGVSLCVASFVQESPQIVTDGSGGAIIAWEDGRGGGKDGIYAQRVDDGGTVIWAADGVSISISSGAKRDPQIAPDGSGGAIVTWEDNRLDSGNIYAQRLDGDGNKLWLADGVSICVATDDQWSPRIASDGQGGAVITWEDYRSGVKTEIRAQRVDQDGNALWLTDGVTVCGQTDGLSAQQVTSDGSGGATVTWYDERGTDRDIYAQRVDANGNVVWQADGVSLCVASDDQGYPQITSDGAGGAIVTWHDDRPASGTDIYAQRVDGEGNALWHQDGVSVCVASLSQGDPRIASDGYFGAIVAWQDKRSGWNDVYAQRVGGVAEVNLPLVAKNH
jgi:hypothetical protein